ncbi:hypothetical protein AC578_1329 [Pseudocercospora eumusae]|uniref:Uncharacterized protein n=1 Tax=Pseudocercospora eumusae TaxID=321146 RepID=A0A139HUJ6_9PEZI|nr:hypothetical protein AC578_1329 [Pseudocercospora eumusae]
MPSEQPLDILILGAGWTSTFLIPHLQSQNLTFAATTRDGRTVSSTKTIPWTFDPQNPSFTALPRAKNILITFPLTGKNQSTTLITGYTTHHHIPQPSSSSILFIQLGSTSIYQQPPSQTSPWISRSSPHTPTHPRALAENALLSHHHTVLSLSGLWDEKTRNPQTWIPRIANTKAEIKEKKSLHLVHGVDVARGVVAVMGNWGAARGERWMVSDGLVYDWWELILGWAGTGTGTEESMERARWVGELMWEEDVRGLPRSMERLGRCFDSREFWRTFGLVPLKARV